MFTPIGAAAKLAQVGIKRETNKYNLPRKMFLEESVETQNLVTLHELIQ